MALHRLNEGHMAPGDTLPRNPKTGRPTIWVWRPSKLKRDQGKLVPVPLPYTRMTTYIDVLDDKAKLHEFGKRAAFKGAALLMEFSPEILVEAAELDLDDPDEKKVLNRHAEKALTVAGAHRKRDRGTLLHKLSEFVDRGEPLPDTVLVEGQEVKVTDQDRADMEAYRRATRDAGLVLGGHIEKPVVHDELKIAGTPDRIGWYEDNDPDGELAGHLIVDLKTGRTDFGALKMAMQLSGYSRSKFYNPATAGTDAVNHGRESLPDDLNLRWGVIINLRPGSAVCTVYWIDLSIGYEALLLAKEVRAMRNKGRKVLRSFGPDVQPVTDEDEEWEEDE